MIKKNPIESFNAHAGDKSEDDVVFLTFSHFQKYENDKLVVICMGGTA